MLRRAWLIWLVRFGLLFGAFMAPALTFWVRSIGTGNAEQAVAGVLPGLAVAVALLVGFSLTF